jgi:hypothetical protein
MKLSPDTVTDAYPLDGAFNATSDTTAASKLKIGFPVPDTAPTVTTADLKRSANAFDRHASDEPESHDEETHDPRSPPPPRSSPAVTVWSLEPKLRPATVNDAYPLEGAFNCESDATAASKLKIGRPVPATTATVTVAALKMSPNGFDRHASVVEDVHDDVKHTPRSPPPPCSSPALAVCSPTPKPRPETVTDAYPLSGAFRLTCDAKAESKVKIG